jgi:hypothetical protein
MGDETVYSRGEKQQGEEGEGYEEICTESVLCHSEEIDPDKYGDGDYAEVDDPCHGEAFYGF